MGRIDPVIIVRQVENLKLLHPEIFEDEESWLLSLESETGVNDLLTSIVRRIEDGKAMIDGTAARLDELTARKDRFTARVNGLRALAMQIMDSAAITKVELPEATISLRKGTPQLVGDVDPESLPDDLCKIKREIDRSAIKNAILSGQEVGGFSLSNGALSIVVRVR